MRSRLLLLLFSSVLLLTASCKKASETSRRIPNEATMVVHINASALNSKLSWKEIREADWFKKEYKNETDSLTKKLMDNPENAGIDLSKDLILFTKMEGAGQYMAFQGTLKDESDFKKFNQNLDKNAKFSENGDISMMKVNEMVVTWKDKSFIYMLDMKSGSRYNSMGEDTRIPEDSLFKFATAIYDLKEENSLLKDERFAEMMKENADAHLWVNSGKLYAGVRDDMGMLNVLKWDALMEGNVSASTLNFENGKVTMKSKQYANAKLTEIYKKMSEGKIQEDLINRIPSENVVAVMAMTYPPQVLKDMIVLLGADGLLNSFLGKLNISVDEIVNAQGGEMLIAVSDIDMMSAVGPVNNPDTKKRTPQPTFLLTQDAPKKQMVKVLFATSVGDKAAFSKVSALVAQLTSDNEDIPPVTSKMEGKWFALGNDANQVNDFISGKGNNQPYAAKMKGHPFAMYIDIRKIAASMESIVPAEGKVKIKDVQNTLVDMLFYADGFKDGYMTSYGEMNFSDKNTNSLKLLNMFIDRMSRENTGSEN